jgi:hypothetical protein
MLQQIDNAIAFAVVMLMLSLIVTAIVQAISAVTDLRGRNLASGLSNLLNQIEPEFRVKMSDGTTFARYIADVVVKHPAIAHAGTRAKAVSQSELVRVLRDLCSAKPATAIDETAKDKLKALLDEHVPGGEETVSSVQVVAQELGTKLPGQEGPGKSCGGRYFCDNLEARSKGRPMVRYRNESSVRHFHSEHTRDYSRDFCALRAYPASRLWGNPTADHQQSRVDRTLNSHDRPRTLSSEQDLR